VPFAPEPPYATRQTDLIRPIRQDSDLSIEEVRRDFPPPGAEGYVTSRYGPQTRSRSTERGSQYGSYLGPDPRRSYNDFDDRRSRTSSTYEEKKIEPRRHSLSRNQKILAAVGGAALAVGGKELWDRRQASHNDRPVSRNALSTAAIGAAGAFAAYEGAELYAKRAHKEEKVKTYTAHRGRNGEVAEYYSSEDEKEPKKSRRKSIVEGALGLAGLGGAAAAAKGHGDRSRRGSPDSGHSRRSKSRGRSRSGGRSEGAAKFQQAAKAALLAGATEAFRVRKEPGGWGGAKGKRILTAAIGAGGIDAAADRNPDVHSKRHILEAVVGGLAGNRLINGSRKEVEREERSRSRSRARSRSRSRAPDGSGGLGSGAGLAALATAGIGALAGKKFLDDRREKSRERSRERSRSRSRRRGSPDSYDSRSPSPRRDKHKRSKSVSDYARKGLAALGIGEAAHEASRSRGDVVEEETVVRHRRRPSDDDDDDYYDDRRHRNSGSSRGDVYGDPRYADSRGGRSSRAKDGRRNRAVAEGKLDPDSDSDSLGSSSGDEKRIKKMKGKQFLTMGLATVATIHAAHNVYQSMEKREARKRAVQEGEMSLEEARKLKGKALLQDAASIGIAALGIKGAISEIKEANEMRHQCKEFLDKKEERHRKRLERLERQRNGNGDSGISARHRADDYYQAPPGRRIDYGPHYADGNPYGNALPAPPVGYHDGR